MPKNQDITSLSDTQLISKVVVFDDHLAFNEIVRRYQSDVRNLLLKLLNFNKTEVDDLYQDVFIKIYKHLKSFRKESSFSTWIYQITYRTFIDAHTKKNKYQNLKHTSGSMMPIIEHPNINNVLDAEKVIMCLSSEEKTVIQLSFINGLSHKEIAEVLACSVGVVKGHIAKAKKRMRELFNNDYGK